MRVVLDTNIVFDFMLRREPYYNDARKLMLLGFFNEVELWISAAQINDLFYMLTRGGKQAYIEATRNSLVRLRRCVRICQVSEAHIDAVLQTNWNDLEDSCLNQVALGIKADFLITRNIVDFELSTIPILDAGGFFEHLAATQGIQYSSF